MRTKEQILREKEEERDKKIQRGLKKKERESNSVKKEKLPPRKIRSKIEQNKRWRKHIEKKRKVKKYTKLKLVNPNTFEQEMNKKIGENANIQSTRKKSKETTKQRRRKDYNKYLQSPAWKKFRNKVIYLRGKKCENCNSNDKLHVHHIHYRNLKNEQLEDVLVLCESCHTKMHQVVSKPPYTLEKLRQRP